MAPRQVLPRALHSIHVGAARSMQRKRRQDSEYDLSELTLQYQLPFSGEAGTLLAWSEPVEIVFEWGFFYAPMQRDSELELPHFEYGSYVLTDAPVGILANVMTWQEEEANGGITGASVVLGAIGGDSETPVPFSASVHVTFQGLATSRDNISENPDLEVTA